jgi:hypothetical protein
MEPKLSNMKLVADFKSADFDGVVVVASSVNDIPHDVLKTPLKSILDVDAAAGQGVFVAAGNEVKRIIFSGTGPLDKDYDDVRRSVGLGLGAAREFEYSQTVWLFSNDLSSCKNGLLLFGNLLKG